MSRINVDDYFLQLAFVVSQRGTCARRQVGCVLVNERRHVLATGYNGAPPGLAHCIDSPCPGAGAPSGTKLTSCEAVHSEASALLQCRNVYDVHTIYCTDSPCSECVKLLLSTSAVRLVFARAYPHKESEKLWVGTKREWHWHRSFVYPFTIGEAVPPRNLTPIEAACLVAKP